MYNGVHMTMTVSITDFRQNLFDYARLVGEKGYEIEIENAGKAVAKLVPSKTSDRVVRARKALKLLKKLGGKFPDFDDSAYRNRRSKAEMEYSKRFKGWSS